MCASDDEKRAAAVTRALNGGGTFWARARVARQRTGVFATARAAARLATAVWSRATTEIRVLDASAEASVRPRDVDALRLTAGTTPFSRSVELVSRDERKERFFRAFRCPGADALQMERSPARR